MANASRVSEIFQQASVAFGRLAHLTLELKLSQAQQNSNEQAASSKWTSTEINELKSAVSRFGSDLEKIARSIEGKTLEQIKQKLDSRTFQEAGLNKVPPTVLQPSVENRAEDTRSGIEHGRRQRSPGESNSDNKSVVKRPRVEEDSVVSKESPLQVESSQNSITCLPISTNSGSFFVRGQVRFNTNADGKTSTNQPAQVSDTTGKVEESFELLVESENANEDPESRYEDYDDSSVDGETGGYYDSDQSFEDGGGEDDDNAAEAT